jgi:hypothetical protein
MFPSLKKRLLAFAQARVRPVDCPHCRHRFQPFTDRPLESFAEFSRPCRCPKCGREFVWTDRFKAEPGSPQRSSPAQQPADSRIERRPVSKSELLYYIPASGRSGCMFMLAAFWTIFSLVAFGSAIYRALALDDGPGPIFIAGFFVAVGGGLTYIAARHRYATHLLYLSAETVRLQRTLLRKRTYVLPADGLTHVKRVEIYTQNYQPVYAIEIGSAEGKRIRFGSAMTDAEKDWLCADINEFLRKIGRPARFQGIAP